MVISMNNFSALSQSALLNLMSKTFCFELSNPPVPELRYLGRMRIVSVILNENLPAEIGLRDPAEPNGMIDIYSVDQLTFIPDNQTAA